MKVTESNSRETPVDRYQDERTTDFEVHFNTYFIDFTLLFPSSLHTFSSFFTKAGIGKWKVHKMSSSSNGASQASAPRDGVPLDDPRSLLRVYPFATYTPTARGQLFCYNHDTFMVPILTFTVAEHFSAHTRTYQSPPTPSSLYPQHVGQFSRFVTPQNAQDWAMRQAGEQRLRVMLEQSQASGNTYSHLYVLSLHR